MCLLEVPLRKVSFVGVKEQLINDSEGLVMMYDEMEDKSGKKPRTFSIFYYRIKRIFSGVYLCITWTNSLTNKYKSGGRLCKLVSHLVQVIHQ